MKKFKSWRDIARDVIAQKLLEIEAERNELTEVIVIKAVSEAYPFGMRKNHPYQSWLKEVGVLKKFLKTRLPMRDYHYWSRQQLGAKAIIPNEVVKGQLSLLGDE